MKSELQTFDGLDNRREILILLERLGSDRERARFLRSLIPASRLGFAQSPVTIQGNCDPCVAYFMFVSVCNEIGVSINEAARRLESRVKQLERSRDR